MLCLIHCDKPADALRAVRGRVIQRFLDRVYEEVDRRLGENPVCTHACDAVTLGGFYKLVMGHFKGSLLPRSSPEIKESILSLDQWLFGEHGLGSMALLEGLSHCNCNPFARREWFKDMKFMQPEHIKNFYTSGEEVGFPTQSHRAYMAGQRQKTGLVTDY